MAVGEFNESDLYAPNGQRIAQRTGSTLTYLHADHLGGTALTTVGAGSGIVQGYRAYGRFRTGGSLPTDHKFTGQKLDASGLYYFNARYYDPELGIFLSPDTLVPDPTNLHDHNRYIYGRGSPMMYNDPTGHWTEEQLEEQFGHSWQSMFREGGSFYGYQAFQEFLLSDQTTSEFDLDVVGAAVQVALLAQGISGTLPDAAAIRLGASASIALSPGASLEGLVNFRSGELSYFLSPSIGGGIALALLAILAPKLSMICRTTKAIGGMPGQLKSS
jgi:RHS repeat-associated protein